MEWLQFAVSFPIWRSAERHFVQYCGESSDARMIYQNMTEPILDLLSYKSQRTDQSANI